MAISVIEVAITQFETVTDPVGGLHSIIEAKVDSPSLGSIIQADWVGHVTEKYNTATFPLKTSEVLAAHRFPQGPHLHAKCGLLENTVRLRSYPRNHCVPRQKPTEGSNRR